MLNFLMLIQILLPTNDIRFFACYGCFCALYKTTFMISFFWGSIYFKICFAHNIFLRGGGGGGFFFPPPRDGNGVIFFFFFFYLLFFFFWGGGGGGGGGVSCDFIPRWMENGLIFVLFILTVLLQLQHFSMYLPPICSI